MMKRIVYFWMMVSALCVTACLDDQTTGAYIPVSEITISETLDTNLYCIVGVEFQFDPSEYITQTFPDCPLTYEWQCGKLSVNVINGEYTVDSLPAISNEKVLKRTFDKLGEYRLRLKVTNQYGSTYKTFLVAATSNFDEGLAMMSKNDAGEAMISVLATQSDEQELLGKTADDFWFVTPEDMPELKEDIVDFAFQAKRNEANDFYMLSRANKQAFYLDQYSLHIVNSDYHFTKTPLLLGLVEHNRGYDLFAWCDDNDFVSWCFVYSSQLPRMLFTTFYDALWKEDIENWDRCQRIRPSSGQGTKDRLFLYDDKTSTVSFTGQVNDMPDQESFFGRTINSSNFPMSKTFEGEYVINVAFISHGGNNTTNGRHDAYVICRNKENPRKITMYRSYLVFDSNIFAEQRNNSYGKQDSQMSYELAEGEVLTLPDNAEMLNKYNSHRMYYHDGRKLFSWLCLQGQITELPKENEAILDIKEVNPNAEICCMAFDATQNYLFIATYDPTVAADRQGSIYAYRISEGSNLIPVRQYEHIGWKPTHLYYKPKLTRQVWEQ